MAYYPNQFKSFLNIMGAVNSTYADIHSSLALQATTVRQANAVPADISEENKSNQIQTRRKKAVCIPYPAQQPDDASAAAYARTACLSFSVAARWLCLS